MVIQEVIIPEKTFFSLQVTVFNLRNSSINFYYLWCFFFSRSSCYYAFCQRFCVNFITTAAVIHPLKERSYITTKQLQIYIFAKKELRVLNYNIFLIVNVHSLKNILLSKRPFDLGNRHSQENWNEQNKEDTKHRQCFTNSYQLDAQKGSLWTVKSFTIVLNYD